MPRTTGGFGMIGCLVAPVCSLPEDPGIAKLVTDFKAKYHLP